MFKPQVLRLLAAAGLSLGGGYTGRLRELQRVQAQGAYQYIRHGRPSGAAAHKRGALKRRNIRQHPRGVRS